jgi:hypothetical protein
VEFSEFLEKMGDDILLKKYPAQGSCHLYCSMVKVQLSLRRPLRPLGLREVEEPTFSDIRLIDGCEVASLTRRQLFTPRKIPGTRFC